MKMENPYVRLTYGLHAHVLAAEKALGRPLPNGVEIHHIDEDKSNNANNNLVICPSKAYHWLLHRRLRALKECGNANWMKCRLCKKWDDPINLYIYSVKDNPTPRAHHRKCNSADCGKRQRIRDQKNGGRKR